MTHGREKSDPAIVAMKPTNNAGKLVAEPVEPTFRRDLDCRRTDDVVARLRRWERLFPSVDRCR
jgi:hypothetical protein